MSSEQLFEASSSVWELILQHCPENEVEEIKRILGTSLIEQAIDLHDEVDTLLEIWRQMKAETDQIVSTPLTSLHLHDPPHIRDRLIQEIKFFISHLRIRATLPGSDRPHLVQYVVGACEERSSPSSGGGGGGSRHLGTASSRDGRETPLRLPSRGNIDGSLASLMGTNDVVEGFSEQINATDIEVIVKHLREIVEDECSGCRSDLRFLQQCLEDEQDFATSVQEEKNKPIPSIKELREFGSQLEKEYLAGAPLPDHIAHPGGASPRFSPLPPAYPKPKHGSTSLNRASKVCCKTLDHNHHEPVASPVVLSIASPVVLSIASPVVLPAIKDEQLVDTKPQ